MDDGVSWSWRSVDDGAQERLRWCCARLLPPGPLPPRVKGAVRDVAPAPDLSGVREGGKEGWALGEDRRSSARAIPPSCPPAPLPPPMTASFHPVSLCLHGTTARALQRTWRSADAADRRGRPTRTTMGHWNALPQVVVLRGPRLGEYPGGLAVAVPPPSRPLPGPQGVVWGAPPPVPSSPPPSFAPSSGAPHVGSGVHPLVVELRRGRHGCWLRVPGCRARAP